METSNTKKWLAGVGGSVAAAIVVALFGIGATKASGVSIEGPTLAAYGTTITLTGYANGDYKMAYWTDELGQQVSLSSDGQLQWYCPGTGTFTISLTQAMTDGSVHSAKHDIQCVAQ